MTCPFVVGLIIALRQEMGYLMSKFLFVGSIDKIPVAQTHMVEIFRSASCEKTPPTGTTVYCVWYLCSPVWQPRTKADKLGDLDPQKGKEYLV